MRRGTLILLTFFITLVTFVLRCRDGQIEFHLSSNKDQHRKKDPVANFQKQSDLPNTQFPAVQASHSRPGYKPLKRGICFSLICCQVLWPTVRDVSRKRKLGPNQSPARMNPTRARREGRNCSSSWTFSY